MGAGSSTIIGEGGVVRLQEVVTWVVVNWTVVSWVVDELGGGGSDISEW